MEKVLAGFIGNGKAGGVDRYLLNFWEEVSSDDIRIDFLTNEIAEGIKEPQIQNICSGGSEAPSPPVQTD